MSKHTKGPWESHNGEVTTQQVNGRSFRRIAAVQDYGMGSLPEVDEANARLIAAAPDLLEALRAMLAEAEQYGFGGNSGGHGTGRVACDQARYAIAKAEGSN
jgi:hypothetical protein